MAEILPTGTIVLYYGMPLAPDYNNTFHFSSLLQQQSYFSTYANKRSYINNSYQRKNRGVLRVGDDYKNLFNANYMSFKNQKRVTTSVTSYDNYEDKTYYAFILEVNYINDGCAEIVYQIDLIQTYMFDWIFKDTFVQRETVAHDSYYDFYLDEGLSVAEYSNTEAVELQFTRNGVTKKLSVGRYVVVATINESYQDSSDGVSTTSIISGAVNGCVMIAFPETNVSSAQNCLAWLETLQENHPEKNDGIIGIYIIPDIILPASPYPAQPGVSATATINFTPNAEGFEGYFPKNKKLYHAPFYNLIVQNSDGASMSYDITRFSSRNFILNFAPTPPFVGYLYPQQYGQMNGHNKNTCPFEYAIPLPAMSTFTWSNDTYKAWLAMNSGQMATNLAGTIAGAGVSGLAVGAGIAALAVGTGGIGLIGAAAAAAGTGISGAMNTYTQINNAYTSQNNAKKLPDSFNGSAANQAAVLAGKFGYFSYIRMCSRDIAESIDQYFTLYGYLVNKVKTPSIYNRTRFTYLKTLGMDIEGDIPSDDKVKLNAIFDSGVRFWADKAHYCEFSYGDNNELS